MLNLIYNYLNFFLFDYLKNFFDLYKFIVVSFFVILLFNSTIFSLFKFISLFKSSFDKIIFSFSFFKSLLLLFNNSISSFNLFFSEIKSSFSLFNLDIFSIKEFIFVSLYFKESFKYFSFT